LAEYRPAGSLPDNSPVRASGAFSVNFEREADYAARAGYELTGAEKFWRTFSLESPDAIRIAKTYPVTPVRFVQMQKVAAEIADKQRHNAPLVPELTAPQAEPIPTEAPH
jgi:hypothetical protein